MILSSVHTVCVLRIVLTCLIRFHVFLLVHNAISFLPITNQGKSCFATKAQIFGNFGGGYFVLNTTVATLWAPCLGNWATF